jgi:hypothetical protein
MAKSAIAHVPFLARDTGTSFGDAALNAAKASACTRKNVFYCAARTAGETKKQTICGDDQQAHARADHSYKN